MTSNTSRDTEIIEFLQKFKVADTTIIQKLFFPSLSSCQKRLTILTKRRSIKRLRNSINQEYIYFIKIPKQLKHSMKVTQLYSELITKYKIIQFKLEPKLNSIKPDALFAYEENNKTRIGMLEVELSNKGFNFSKYKNFIQSGEAKENNIPAFNVFLYDGKKDKLEIIESKSFI